MVRSFAVKLPHVRDIEALRPVFAASAQRIYDSWQQDEDGIDPELGTGGVCHLIADAIVEDISSSLGYDVRVTTKSLSDVQHVNVLVALREGAYEIDIP